MGFMLRVRLASFFAAEAAAGGGYFLYKDYKVAHDSTALQIASGLGKPPHHARGRGRRPKEAEGVTVDGNGTEAGQIIVTTIGGQTGKPKQETLRRA